MEKENNVQDVKEGKIRDIYCWIKVNWNVWRL